MLGELERARAPAIELIPVDWTYCDGVDTAELVAGNLRVALYVTDVAGGAEHQDRLNLKVVLPVSEAVTALRRLISVLRKGSRPRRASLN